MCNSPDIFQENMSELFFGLEPMRVYIDDLLHIIKGSWTENITVLEEMFARLQKSGLKVNAGNPCFDAHKFEYLGYDIIRDGVMTIPKKVEAIKDLAVPKTRKLFLQLIGMINFYRDMWQRRSDLLALLTDLTSKNFKYKWKDKHQKCVDAIKCVIGLELFLA